MTACERSGDPADFAVICASPPSLCPYQSTWSRLSLTLILTQNTHSAINSAFIYHYDDLFRI